MDNNVGTYNLIPALLSDMPEGKFKKQLGVFKAHGGMLRTAQALRLGVHSRDLYAMTASKVLEPVSRGLYRVSDIPGLSEPDLVTVALRIPKGVICLISALDFHGITTEIPHQVHVALPGHARKPRLDHPPTRFAWFTEPAFSASIKVHVIDGVSVRVYCPEKTVADCFKARNKIGLDVAIEALKLCLKRKGAAPDALLKYAKICRVERVMKPYLEALA